MNYEKQWLLIVLPPTADRPDNESMENEVK